MHVSEHECIVDGDDKYETINEAFLDCLSDPKCVGIVDGSCDNMGDFSACFDGIKDDYAQVNNAEIPSCVYKKPENYGKFIKV